MKRVTTNNGITLLRFQAFQPADGCFYPEPFLYKLRFLYDDGVGATSPLRILTPSYNSVTAERYVGAGFEISFREEVLIMLRCQHFESTPPLNKLRTQTSIQITDSVSRKKMEVIIREFELTYKSAGTQASIKLFALLKILLVYVIRQYAHSKRAADNLFEEMLLNKFEEILRNDSDRFRSVSKYASQLSVTPVYLTYIIRKRTGNPPSKLIQNHTLFLAKLEAIASDRRLKEVAYTLGFTDCGHFSKFFRQKTGMTYSRFKQTFQSF